MTLTEQLMREHLVGILDGLILGGAFVVIVSCFIVGIALSEAGHLGAQGRGQP